jgi:hypothetical protein
MMISSLVLLLLGTAHALEVPRSVSRRAALAGVAGIPAAVSAANPLATDSFSGYKSRDYGNGQNTAVGSASPTKAAVTACEEGQRLAPDGFGGKKCAGPLEHLALDPPCITTPPCHQNKASPPGLLTGAWAQ